MILLVSVILENFDAVRKALIRQGRPPPGQLGAAHPLDAGLIAQMGGALLAIDWDRRQVLRRWPLQTPAGFAWPDPAGPIWVASATGDVLSAFIPEEGRILGQRSHPAFNDLHSVQPDGDGLLLTSSGADAVLRLDSTGEVDWIWRATQAGFDEMAGGGLRQADPSADLRGRQVPTLKRSFHPNAAIRVEGEVWVSSFHRGCLGAIDPTTGGWHLLRDGLDHPHSIIPLNRELRERWGLPPDSGTLICDTGRGCIRALGGADLGDRRVWSDLRWVQDAETGPFDRLWALDNRHFGRSRGGNRLLELDPQQDRCLGQMEWPAQQRLFAVMALDGERAERVARSCDAAG